MTAQNVQKLKEAYEALNTGDAPGALAVLDDEAEWHEHSDLPEAGCYRGRATIQSFLESFLDSWEAFVQEIEDVVDVDDKVAIYLHMHGRGKGSGIAVETRYAHVWTMRGGRGVRVDAYYDRDRAREALQQARSN